MDVAAFARAASLILSEVIYHFGPYDRFADVFTYMVDQLDLMYGVAGLYYTVSEAYITRILRCGRGDDNYDAFIRAARRWFDVASNLGLDIQTLTSVDFSRKGLQFFQHSFLR
jgi:hypothetical protein